jgi:predicted transposase YbfD/YdcC
LGRIGKLGNSAGRQALLSSRPAVGNALNFPEELPMVKHQRVRVDQIAAHFECLEDPRSAINRQHPLVSVVVIALMAVLAGAGGPTAIARWAALKADLLKEVLPLPAGIPRKDVFRRVLLLLKPQAFQACFAAWLRSLRTQAAEATGIDQPVFAVDGKTARRSHDRAKGLGALHAVTVWASEFGLALGQVACAEKSNEITAIPEVLRLVDLEGAILTIDAMGTQKAIAAQIIDGGADYVLALKGNQGTIHEAVVNYLEEHGGNDFANVTVRRWTTQEKGHGREEVRGYFHLPVPAELPGRAEWKGLRSIGMAVSSCQREGNETIETRYYLSSLPLGVKRFAHAVRSHWGIENGCHWSLDLTYREDELRLRTPQLRENMAWLNRFTLSLLHQHPGNDSIAMKRRSCGWNDDYLLEVLAGTTT